MGAAERVERELVIKPHPGPQMKLLTSAATITFFGGAARGGKTFAALLALARWFQIARYAAVLFRREAVHLIGADSAWEQSKGLMGALGGKARESPVLSWRWPDYGSAIEMRHLQNAGDELDHQGKGYACIVFEEVTHFLESQFWYLVSRLYSACEVRAHVIATLNPDPDSWVFPLVSWWIDPITQLPIPERDGVLRWFVRGDDDTLTWADTREELEAAHPGRRAMSVTFIMAKFADNLTAVANDPEYGDRLDALPSVDRDRLKFGKWTRASKSGGYFKESEFPIVQTVPGTPIRTVRAWDLAASERSAATPDPDFTRGLKGCRYTRRPQFLAPGQRPPEDAYTLLDLVGGQLGVADVDALIERTAIADGRSCEIAFWQDPGQAGKAQAHALRHKLANMGFMVTTIPTSKDKISYAKVWSPLARDGHISVIDAPWAKPFLQRLEAFPNGRYKDDVDAGSLLFQVFTANAQVRSIHVRGA
jgi:predicted phage terminase large subunit-like protein